MYSINKQGRLGCQTFKGNDQEPPSSTSRQALLSTYTPEGGWGWVCVIASCISHFTFGGTFYSIGMFYLAFIEHFQSSDTATSWIGAIFGAMFGLFGMCN